MNTDACYCDYEPADVYKATRPLARKIHRCNECGDLIEKGDRYERVWAIWNGTPTTAKTCCYCLAIRDLLDASSCCFCWEHFGMLADAHDEVFENGYNMPGIRMAVGRLVIERKRARLAHPGRRLDKTLVKRNTNRSQP